jgi:hypothetical protein
MIEKFSQIPQQHAGNHLVLIIFMPISMLHPHMYCRGSHSGIPTERLTSNIENVMFVIRVDVDVLQYMHPKCRGELICTDQQLAGLLTELISTGPVNFNYTETIS